MLEIDGSHGEGGGQILRTSLSLSCLLQRPFRLFNIRKRRKKPGLMPQHLMCIHALKSISGAKVHGDSLHSAEIIFEPSEIKPGNYFFDIGTAGSTTLLFQAIIPPLIFSKSFSSITLKGGTHVPWSPAFDFIREVFLPILRLTGINVSATISSYGFYPKGGGEISVQIVPVQKITGICLTHRQEISTVEGISSVSNLSISIAERQKNAAVEFLARQGIKADIKTQQVKGLCRGTFIFLKTVAGTCIAGFSSLGERSKKAETVGDEAAAELIRYYFAGGCLDHHLADQLVLYLALARDRSSFTTSRITDHLLTNLGVTELFTGAKCSVKGSLNKAGSVHIDPSTGPFPLDSKPAEA